jgi:IS5 family transposase
MLGKSSHQFQLNMFSTLLIDLIDLNNNLSILANKLPWGKLEKQLACYYSHKGQPSKPIRLMVGLLILKYLYNLSEEAVVDRWSTNPYFQFFCGEVHFQWTLPCDPSDLSHFRKRIGEEGAQIIFQHSIELHGPKVYKSNEAIVDTTVQKKNITYPTDVKFSKKILDNCNKIARKAGIKVRQSYRYISKKLMRIAHQKSKVARVAARKLKTLARRQLRDIKRKLSEVKQLPKYEKELNKFERVLTQNRKSKNKIYSLHESEVACIAKGKASPKYEFGSKLSIAMISKKNIIVGVENFLGNPHDSKTLERTMEKVKENVGKEYKRVLVDKGYRGIKEVGKTRVVIPSAKRVKSKYERDKRRKENRRRSAIEAAISHLKNSHRVNRNYLKGRAGDQINALLGATAFNIKRLLGSDEFKALKNEVIYN